MGFSEAEVPVVTGHVVSGPGGSMPSELAHAPWSPPCGPGPSHAPGSFVLVVESAKDLYNLDSRPQFPFRSIIASCAASFPPLAFERMS